MINIVIPMAGLGSRFANAGFQKPKPFIDVMGKPMIARVMDNLCCNDARYILIARQEHLDQEKELVAELKRQYNVHFISIDRVTEGAACTVLFARSYINSKEPLMIANSDQIVELSMDGYIADSITRGLDGSILTFVDAQRDPKWSFAKINTHGMVTEVKEKEAISEYATVGIYFFAQGSIFVDAALDMIVRNDRVNNEFYVCPTYNYAIRSERKIGIFNIPHDKMHGIGTPEDLSAYLSFINGN